MKYRKTKKKRQLFPKSLIRSLSQDIKGLMETSEGQLLALEILDEIPYELRPRIIEGLSSFYMQEIADFFYLVREEYGPELSAVCNRALEKFQMAGFECKAPRLRHGRFYKAFVTRTRHTGQLTLDVAWKIGTGTVDVECFFLSFNPDGLHGFFVISDMPIIEYEYDRKSLPDMLEISMAEACYLIQSSYACNIRCMTRPALGKFLYGKYLKVPLHFSEDQAAELTLKITPELNPRETVNTFFFAQRHRDLHYINGILSNSNGRRPELSRQVEDLTDASVLLIEGQATQSKSSGLRSIVKAYGIYADEEDELFKQNMVFYLNRNEKHWLITDIFIDDVQPVGENWNENPLFDKVECLIYEILDMEELFRLLEELDEIREVGELPFGVHLRLPGIENDPRRGVFFLTGVQADIVVNGDEMVVISQESEVIEEISNLMAKNPNAARPSGRHQVEIITAYSYLSGQYLNFEDMLDNDGEELLFEDGLRFLTARYLVKDRERVRERLELLKSEAYIFPENCEVFYEFAGPARDALVAEYVLGDNWATVSAFGDRELLEVRERFEEGIKDCLEFEGLEVRCEGVFELITGEVKKRYPDLEEKLKQAYLNKWYESKLKPLRGLSPQDASASLEGKTLLWRMFKEMRRKEKKSQSMGMRRVIELKEYMKKVNKNQEP